MIRCPEPGSPANLAAISTRDHHMGAEFQLLIVGAQPATIISSELRQALIRHLLPKVDLHALASLACTCLSLRDLVYQQAEIWHAAAAAALPPQHSFPSMASRAAIQAVMQRRADVKHNISTGHVGTQVELRHYGGPQFAGMVVHKMLFSPSGDRLAVTEENDIVIFSMQDGKELWCESHASMEKISSDESDENSWHHGNSIITCCKEVVNG